MVPRAYIYIFIYKYNIENAIPYATQNQYPHFNESEINVCKMKWHSSIPLVADFLWNSITNMCIFKDIHLTVV